LPNRNQDSAAHQHRAEALLALDRAPEALESYLEAVAKESEVGAVQTEVRRDFAFLVATRKLQSHYQQALSILGDGSQLLFPIQQFTHHASIALISAHLKDRQSAAQHAQLALNAAAPTTSVVRYHSGLGLVGEDLERRKKGLTEIAATVAR
jgi:tetratricopeptide (TPR) repeat protein